LKRTSAESRRCVPTTAVELALGELLHGLDLLALGLEARELADGHAEALEPLGHRAEVLLDEDGRGREDIAACLPPCTLRKIARRATSVLP